ncbi:MAG: TIGR01777 family oxidoreductase [Dehalococcoidia bacterium]
MKKNVFVIFGVSGLIGTQLAIILNQSDQYIIGITRNRASTHKKLSFLNEVLDTNDIQSSTFENPNNNFIFINLSGEPLIGIWTKNKRERVLNSRLDGTNKSKEIITKYNLKTSSIISASGIGIYENNFSELQSEKSKTSDQSFVSQMSGKLEERHHSFNNAKNVSLRFGIVLSNKGGSLSYLKLIYNLGLGGKIGNGNQWWSWIHIEDLVNAIIHIIKNKLEGPINITSPIPERQKDFAKILGKVLKRPSFMFTPGFVLQIVLGKFSTELLHSKKISPDILNKTKFKFKYPSLNEALNDVYK